MCRRCIHQLKYWKNIKINIKRHMHTLRIKMIPTSLSLRYFFIFRKNIVNNYLKSRFNAKKTNFELIFFFQLHHFVFAVIWAIWDLILLIDFFISSLSLQFFLVISKYAYIFLFLYLRLLYALGMFVNQDFCFNYC